MPTLFYDGDVYVEQFNKLYDHPISKEFAACADSQLTNYFEQVTGLKSSKKVTIGWSFPEDFFVEVGKVSRFASKLWVNHNTNIVVIAWKSKSGKTYRLSNKDIDCSDIEFWFEKLDTLLYHKQLYPNLSLPFKLNDPGYELTVHLLNIDLNIELRLKPNEFGNEKKIELVVSSFLEHYNDVSVEKDRKYGVIHNWKSSIASGTLRFEIDLGSAGMRLVKSLLQMLTDLRAFESVTLN